MSNTESFIITVPKRLSKDLDNGTNLGYILEHYRFDLAMALINRVPITDKELRIERNALASGLDKATETLDNIGKGE